MVNAFKAPISCALSAPGSAGDAAEPDRRAQLFRESPTATLRRIVLGSLYTCHPKRIADVPHLLWGTALDLARGGTRVPSPAVLRRRPDAFGGIVREASPETILAAARLGFFPWCHFGPLKWWTRAQRMVLFFPEQHISRRFRPLLRRSPWRVTFDTAFDDVIKACAEPRSNRGQALTWITPQIMWLYSELNRQGHAHSVEVWNDNGELIGGGYGLAVGRIFITESQFFREPNASKIGYHVLNQHLSRWGYVLNDNKDWTQATASMGFRTIARSEHEEILARHAHEGGRSGRWYAETGPAEAAA